MHKLQINRLKTLGFYGFAILLALWALLYPFIAQKYISEYSSTPRSKSDVPNFSSYKNVTEKKQAFFAYLMPEVKIQNELVLEERHFVLSMQQKLKLQQPFSTQQQQKLQKLKFKYRVDGELSETQAFEILLRRVDIIPPELVLVQAANESAWGTSRFARQGYNFFGLWCFKRGCGFVPNDRDDDADHEVARFDSLSQSVQRYIRNLNRHRAYKELRGIRQDLRNNQQEITAEALAMGLISYSERGQDYIDELLSMIKVNRRHMPL
jgi:Bax protein